MEYGHLVFRAWESKPWLVFCVGSAVLAIVLIVMLLRYERRLVPRRVGNTLLVLRTAIVTLLLLTLLEPVLSWTVRRERSGRILIALDVSDSMSTTDNHASRAEKLRWARSLGMIGNPTVNQRLDQWIAAWQRGEEPQWVGPDETADPERRAELERIRRETIEGIFAELDKIPRKEIALRLLTKTAKPLLKELEPLGRVELRLFAGEPLSADESTLSEQLRRPPETVLADTTDLSAGLAALDEADTVPVLGVIVFTDGRHNTGQDPLSAARLLGSARVPVFPVLLGSERRPRDLSIGDLDYPPTVFKDDHPLLKVTVNTSGFEDQPIEIVLEKEGDDSARQTREIIANGQPMTIEFELNAAEVGRHQYTVRTDVQPDETRDDNNEKSFAMSVVDDTAHVLLLEGEPRWEFRFINNALKRDERVDVRCVLFDQPFIGLLPNPFFPQRLRLPVDADAMDESPFADMDLVIVGDVSPRQMDRRAWQLLEKFVAEGGGTLVLVAGKYSFPRRYRWEVVERLLPLTGWRPVSVQNASARTPPAVRGFRLKLTPEGEREVFLQFSALEEENRTIWANLPGHTWGLLGQAKPSATVLAYAERPQAAADPLGDDNGEQWDSLQQERQNAVIVHQHYGFGQVVWIGIDSTWRWRYRVGDKYHHRFWGQLARWAAETKAAAGNAFVKFGPVRSDVAVDEAITIRARWAQQFLRRNPDLKARAEIFREKPEGGKQRVAVLELKPHETQPLVYEGRLRSLPAGAYEVQLVVDDAKVGAEPIVAPLYVHERLTPELTDVSCNRPLLAQIADLTGGRLILPDQVHQIPKLLRPDVGPEVLHPEIPVWDHWALLLVFFTLLTAEWIVRKLNGLP